MKNILKWFAILVMSIACVAFAAGTAGYGGQVTREDLFKRFFTWDSSSDLFNAVPATSITFPTFIAAPLGTFNGSGISIHDTGIGPGGGLHMTIGDEATAFIPFLRPTADDTSLTYGGGRTPDGATFNPVKYTATSGYDPMFVQISSVSPASGSGSFSSYEINATLNGVSSGTYAGLVIDPVVTAFTGGTVLLFDYGTTTTNYVSGYTSKFKGDTSGNMTMAGKIAPTNGTTCTLNAGTPATCTATVTAGAICVCSDVGSGSTVAAGGCAVSLSGTTLTVTGATAASNVVNIWCNK